MVVPLGQIVAFFLSQSCSFFSLLVVRLDQNCDTASFKHIDGNSICVTVGFAIPSWLCTSDSGVSVYYCTA